jgi:hypothetical protein
MTLETQATVDTAAQAVHQLIGACRKGGPLHTQSPRAVAHVSRTGKWLLNAIQRLQRDLDQRPDHAVP